jgi:glucosyltransferase Lgt1/2/3
MAYSFAPHRHVKIWLSKDSDIFLNLENQIRLVKMRDINPKDTINFIYDSRL